MHKKALISIILFTISFFGFSQPGVIDISYNKVFLEGKTFYIHKVKAGQTSWSISKAYNILVNELAEQNPTVFDSLSIGQELKIPVIKGRNYSANEIKYADKFIFHYIEKGETAYSVSRKYEYDVNTLYKWNQDAKTSFIPGQVIRLPKKNTDLSEIEFFLDPNNANVVDQAITKPKSNFVFHEVVKGNTLYSISKMYDVEQKKLIELNPGCDKILSIGTLIKIKEIDNTVEIVDNSQSVIVDNNVKIDKPKDEKTQIDITPNRVDTVNNRNIELIEHTVRKGETLFSLSRKYNVTKEDILNHNKGCSQTLTIGDKLKIPVVKDSNPVIVEENVIEEVKDDFKREDKRYYYHLVEAKESISDIARFYHIKIRRIKKANSFMKERDLIEGDIIRIPKKDIRDIQLVSRKVKERFSATKINEESIIEKVIANPKFNLETHNYFEKRDTIRIAVMLPFYLYENDSIELNDTIVEEKKDESRNIENVFDAFMEPEIKIFQNSKIFLEFYEGFLLALDSLNKMGVNLKLYTYDTERNPDTVLQILRNPELTGMDMIFGPVYDENIILVNKFAKDNGIIIISPLMSGNNDSIQNKQFFRAIPRTDTQIKQFSKVLSEYYHKNIIIMHYGTPQEKKIIEIYKKYLIPELYSKTDSTKVNFSVIELNKDKAFDIIKPRRDENEKEVFDHPIKNALIEDIPNLVIIPSKNRGLVSNTIRQLNTLYEEVASDYEITVAGFSNARDFENIDLLYLHNLEFHTFTPSFVDYSDENVKKFVEDYRARYSSEPSQFSIQGYDLLWYFTNSYVYYGPEFYEYNNYIYSDTTIQCLQNDFDFIMLNINGVYENQKIYVLKYEQNYDVIRLDEMLKREVNTTISIPLVPIDKKTEDEDEPEEENGNLRLYRKPL